MDKGDKGQEEFVFSSSRLPCFPHLPPLPCTHNPNSPKILKNLTLSVPDIPLLALRRGKDFSIE
jgi:hypothetical protein